MRAEKGSFIWPTGVINVTVEHDHGASSRVDGADDVMPVINLHSVVAKSFHLRCDLFSHMGFLSAQTGRPDHLLGELDAPPLIEG